MPEGKEEKKGREGRWHGAGEKMTAARSKTPRPTHASTMQCGDRGCGRGDFRDTTATVSGELPPLCRSAADPYFLPNTTDKDTAVKGFGARESCSDGKQPCCFLTYFV